MKRNEETQKSMFHVAKGPIKDEENYTEPDRHNDFHRDDFNHAAGDYEPDIRKKQILASDDPERIFIEIDNYDNNQAWAEQNEDNQIDDDVRILLESNHRLEVINQKRASFGATSHKY